MSNSSGNSRSPSNTKLGRDTGERHLCLCGFVARIYTAWKETDNAGRRFYGCPNYQVFALSMFCLVSLVMNVLFVGLLCVALLPFELKLRLNLFDPLLYIACCPVAIHFAGLFGLVQ